MSRSSLFDLLNALRRSKGAQIDLEPVFRALEREFEPEEPIDGIDGFSGPPGGWDFFCPGGCGDYPGAGAAGGQLRGGWAEHVDEVAEAYNARPHEAHVSGLPG